MICPNCGEKISDSAKFCTKCGANIPEILEQKKADEKVELKDKEMENSIGSEVEEKNEAESEEEKIEEKPEAKQEETKSVKEKEKKVKATKTKKKHTGLKIIIILILLIIIAGGVLYGLYKIDLLPENINSSVSPIIEKIEGLFGIENEKEDKDTKNESKTEDDDKNEKKDEIKKKDDEEELVFDYYNKTLFGNTYKVPEINLDYDNIKEINEEIADLVDSKLRKYEKLSELPEGEIAYMDYVWYENDNILSLVFYNDTIYTSNYYVFNIDIYTGEEIDNKGILDAAKIDEDEFITLCQEATEDYYDNYLYYKGIQDNAEISAIFDNSKEDSIKASNFSLSKTSMFLNKNGELNIIAKFTTIAGAGYNYKSVNIENIKKNSKPLFEGPGFNDNSESQVDTDSSNTTSETTSNILNSSLNTVQNENTDVTNSVITPNATNTINP